MSQTSDTFLVLGGNGPCAEQAKKAAAKFENIAYLGYVQPQRVPFYTALADIVFYGFDPDNPNARFSAPNKLFECLAAGKAMLTGDFGEIGRIVREASCGVIIPDYEIEHIRAAIDSLSGDILQEYGNNARQAAEHRYCWKRAGEILLTNYLTLTAVKSRAHAGAPIGKTK